MEKLKYLWGCFCTRIEFQSEKQLHSLNTNCMSKGKVLYLQILHLDVMQNGLRIIIMTNGFSLVTEKKHFLIKLNHI